MATWLGYDYETLAVNSENETIAIVYTCPDRTQFSDGSKTKYASCDVTAFWSPPIEECERKCVTTRRWKRTVLRQENNVTDGH